MNIKNRYEVMLHCWCQSSEERPTFSELVKELGSIINPIANYMEMGAISELVGESTEMVAISELVGESTETGAISERVGESTEGVTNMELKDEAGRKRSLKRCSLTEEMLRHGVETLAGISIFLTLDQALPEELTEK